MDQLRFTIPEIVSLIGTAQCVYILIYMIARVGRLSRTALPSLYFFILGAAFFLDFAQRFVGGGTPYYPVLQWLLWFSGPPLSLLVIVQIAQITKAPALRYYAILALPVLALLLSALAASWDESCKTLSGCQTFQDWLVVHGQIAGTLSLLAIWLAYKIWSPLIDQKAGRERYWLIISLILVNAGLMLSLFGYYSERIDETILTLTRNILGLGFVYLVMTSLFRIYPPSVRMMPASESDETVLSDKELENALKIEGLLEYEKVYHEPGYSRSDLARELQIPETALSKIINLHFRKSFPQLLNEYRVADAKRLLTQTAAEINVVAQEVGFNSVASFNRVFKEIAGQTPSQYRAAHQPDKNIIG